MAVGDHLPRLSATGREAEPVHHVVESALQQTEQGLSGHAPLTLRPLEIAAELALENAVDPLGFLLLPELHAVGRQLAPVEAMLSRRVVAPLDGALVGEAASTLEEELHPFPTAEPALRVAIARHDRLLHPPPLGRAAAVVRDRGDVTDGGDLQADRLERPDGGFAPGPWPAHEHLDLLEAELHALAGGDLGRCLGGEWRALAGPLEASAPRARPGHHVAHLVGKRHDRVVEGGLHVGHAHAHLAPLAPLAALLAGRLAGWLFGHGQAPAF